LLQGNDFSFDQVDQFIEILGNMQVDELLDVLPVFEIIKVENSRLASHKRILEEREELTHQSAGDVSHW
jgi:uncharacterized protein YfbU (UPF0304 family)